jgi:hypothetical protein
MSVGLPQLDNLVRIRQLKSEPASQLELSGLIRSGWARLTDSQTESLSLDGRFDLAYNAAHAFSLAALRWHGYRSESRYLVFQCLEHTVKLPPDEWRVLDQAHRKRNVAEYEGHLEIDKNLLESLIGVTSEVAARVEALGALRSPG